MTSAQRLVPALSILLLFFPVVAEGEAPSSVARAPGPAFGLLLDAGDAGALPAPPDLPADHPLVARIVARWDEVETEKGVYDWSRIAPAVETLAAGRFRIVLCLTGSNPLYVSEGNGTGLVLANQDMTYSSGSYSYTFSNATFVSGGNDIAASRFQRP